MDSNELPRLQLAGIIPDDQRQAAEMSLVVINYLLEKPTSRLAMLEVIEAPETIEQLSEPAAGLEIDIQVLTPQFILNALRRMMQSPYAKDGMAVDVGPAAWEKVTADANWTDLFKKWKSIKIINKINEQTKQNLAYQLTLIKLGHLVRQENSRASRREQSINSKHRLDTAS
jgi:hypothetical protein